MISSFTKLILLISISLQFTLSTKEPDLEIIPISDKVLNFIFREKGKNRFEMPKKDPFPFHKNVKGIETDWDFGKEYTYE